MTNIEATQREIRKRVDDIGATIEMHENAIEGLRLILKQIRRSCKHPNKYAYSATGEMVWTARLLGMSFR